MTFNDKLDKNYESWLIKKLLYPRHSSAVILHGDYFVGGQNKVSKASVLKEKSLKAT